MDQKRFEGIRERECCPIPLSTNHGSRHSLGVTWCWCTFVATCCRGGRSRIRRRFNGWVRLRSRFRGLFPSLHPTPHAATAEATLVLQVETAAPYSAPAEYTQVLGRVLSGIAVYVQHDPFEPDNLRHIDDGRACTVQVRTYGSDCVSPSL